MRILLSNKYYYPRGGDCIHTIQLKGLLEQNGHEVAVFSMHYPSSIESKYSNYWPSEISFSTKSPMRLIASLFRPFGTTEVESKWNTLLNDFKPDIVHLHNIHSQLSPIIAKLAREKNIPVVWTLHDYKLLCPAYTFMDSSAAICEDCLKNPDSVIAKSCIKGSKLASYLGYYESKKWNLARLENYTRFFIAPSLFMKSKMVQGGYREGKILQLYNFADNDKFNNRIIKSRSTDVIYVGRLSREKGVETLCQAFLKTKEGILTIIGDGSEKEILEKSYLSDRIRFLGFQPWNVIKDYLSQASFMVIPSEWYENNPLTMIEAFALGTPVLGANIGGIPELIEENKNGMIFQSGDISDLKEKIDEMLLKNDWDYEDISREASRKFSESNYYQRLLDLYQTALKY